MRFLGAGKKCKKGEKLVTFATGVPPQGPQGATGGQGAQGPQGIQGPQRWPRAAGRPGT